MHVLTDIKNFIDIIQSLVIIGVTLFTARWTWKTFAHKEKIDELKELKRTIMLYYHKIQLFCAQVRPSQTPDDAEIAEKLELAAIHNKLVRLYSLDLYTKPEFREKIQNIIGIWISNDRINAMQGRRASADQKTEAWQKFDKEYKEAFTLIDKEAGRHI